MTIVDRFAGASLLGVANGRRLAAELRDLHEQWLGAVTARRHATVWKLLPLVLSQPAVTVRFVQDQTGASQPAAQHVIDQLVEAGVLSPASQNRRNRVWISQNLIRTLDNFAARARRD